MKSTARSRIAEFCQEVCRRIGETYVGPCSVSVDPTSGRPTIDFKGKDGWHSVRVEAEGIRIIDPQGRPAQLLTGLAFPDQDLSEPQSINVDPLANIQPFQSPRLQPGSAPSTERRPARGKRPGKPAGTSAQTGGGATEGLSIRPEMGDKDVLEAVQRYLVEVHEVHSVLMEKESANWLKVEVRGTNMPDVLFVISTNVSGEEENRGVTERVVIVRLLTQIRVDRARREGVLETINSYHVHSWAGCFRIHDDHEIEGNWPINTLGCGIHVEYIWDAMVRLLSGWKRLYPEISKVIYG